MVLFHLAVKLAIAKTDTHAMISLQLYCISQSKTRYIVQTCCKKQRGKKVNYRPEVSSVAIKIIITITITTIIIKIVIIITIMIVKIVKIIIKIILDLNSTEIIKYSKVLYNVRLRLQ